MDPIAEQVARISLPEARLIGLLRAGQGIALFFLTCIVVAGVFGAVTVSARILLVQALPAALAIVAVLLGR